MNFGKICEEIECVEKNVEVLYVIRGGEGIKGDDLLDKFEMTDVNKVKQRIKEILEMTEEQFCSEFYDDDWKDFDWKPVELYLDVEHIKGFDFYKICEIRRPKDSDDSDDE